MKQVNIKNKLESIGIPIDEIKLGDFDYIGEFTAKRHRTPDDKLYNSVGVFYRSNYERGILVYHLIRKFNVRSVLEIGFGRGYVSFCAAKAFLDSGIDGKITSIDPTLDKNFLEQLMQVLPKQLFNYLDLCQGTSGDVIPKLTDGSYDLVYIDGDHSYEGTKLDWELTKDKWNMFMLFDDYHLPTKNDPGIQCSKLIDEIDDDSKELIMTDRRIFVDDRGIKDEDLNYGQVLLTKPTVQDILLDW